MMSDESNLLISVLMSVFNEPLDWVKEAIDSILTQSYRYFEFIIVNDNPQDGERIEFLQCYKKLDSRIILIFNEENIGLARSLNKAIAISNGRYIARMDADDIALPFKLKMQFDYLEAHPEVAVCGTWGRKFGNVPKFSYKRYKTPTTPDQVWIASMFASPMIHPSVMLRSRVLKCNRYNSALRKAQDYELWGRLLLHDVILCNIPSCLLKYRVTRKSQTVDSLSKQEEVAKIVRKELLIYSGISISEEELSLHNDICANRFCSTINAERWLQKLKCFLSERYPSQILYISQLIGDRWAMVCLSAGISYRTYRKSSLYPGFLRINTLRFLKRYL